MTQPFTNKGLVLIGCGFMGKALLEGWLAKGIPPLSIYVQDPAPSDWLAAQQDLRLNQPLPAEPAVIVIATKPQILDKVLPPITRFGNGQTVIVSIAAGAPIALFERAFGVDTPVVRAMPNLPATVGAGITALYANGHADAVALTMVSELFSTVGVVVQLTQENQMHTVTGLSGSGPAYVFALAEAMSRVGEALGLPKDLAKALTYQTLNGAGAMLARPDADATALREAVTSKGGTTASGLDAMMVNDIGIAELMHLTITAATDRSIELGAQ